MLHVGVGCAVLLVSVSDISMPWVGWAVLFLLGWAWAKQAGVQGGVVRYFLETKSPGKHRRLKSRAGQGERKHFYFLNG